MRISKRLERISISGQNKFIPTRSVAAFRGSTNANVAAALPGVLISHPHGNANVREAALAFADAGLLRQFWTGVAWNPESTLARYVPRALRRQLERRAIDPRLRPFLNLHPWREAFRLAAMQIGFSTLAGAPALSPNACHEDLDRRVARALYTSRDQIDLVYAYDHCALESFRVAARLGQRRVYDLPIGYWRALEATILSELDAWPAWRSLAPALDFQTDSFQRKDEEIALAGQIIVPSRFVARTLREHLPDLPPVSVVPFGAPQAVSLTEAELDRPAHAPLRLLYVGSMDLRKGIPYLCQAIKALGGAVVVTVVGRGGQDCAPLRQALVNCVRFDSLPRAEVLSLMRNSDVLVFPTLFEGMALVVGEALSQGCVVITTPNSGAEDLIENGHNGFLVEPRSTDALVRTVVKLDEDRNLLRSMRHSAQLSCAAWSWQRYRHSLRAAVQGEVSS